MNVLPLSVLLLGTALTARAALITYYPLNETSGNVANDAATSDGAQNATASVASSSWQSSSGILGGAVKFSPTAQTDVDEAFIYNGTGFLSGSAPFTLSLWVNTSDTSNWSQNGLFVGDGSAFDKYDQLGETATHIATAASRDSTSGGAIAASGVTAVNNGVWHQLTAVFASTTSRSLYIDGKLVATSTVSVPSATINRIGLGALTRSTQTDAYSGLLDEVGIFNEGLTAAKIALLNAFPRYDNVPLNDTDFDSAINIFNNQSGSVATGAWNWSYATGLTGVAGTTGLSGSSPYVVLDASGHGLLASPVPEPGVGTLCLVMLAMAGNRRRI